MGRTTGSQMIQVETIYTEDRIALSTVALPIPFYGENIADMVVVSTFSNEKKLSRLKKLLTGKRYSYTLTITDE